MRVAIMQPYFAPYLGYFSLIKHTDKFLLFDIVQSIRHGWIERNRILKPAGGWQYIRIPLEKHHQRTLIKDVHINNSEDWRNRIISQLAHYKKEAPYYEYVINLIKTVFKNNYKDITTLNMEFLNAVCEYLNINFNCEIVSKIKMDLGAINAADEWALNICKALKYDEYWNPSGGTSFFDREKYERNGIKLFFHKVNMSPYKQKRNQEVFEAGLSIIDMLMFNDKNKINCMLDDYELS